MRTILAAVLLAGLTGSGARAETNEQKGKRVVDAALAALGGQAFLAMRDRTESGRAYSFYHEKLSGLSLAHIYTRYLDHPESSESGGLAVRERLGEPGLVFESRGSDFYENRPVEIVDVVDANNDTVTVYFDQLTKLPTRQRFFRRDPIDNTRLEEVSIFAKYRDVGGGAMWPLSIRRERNGEKIFEMYSDGVEVNQNLREDLFTLPADMKILPKPK